LIESIPAN